MPYLTLKFGGAGEETFILKKKSTTIGRGDAVDIFVDDPNMSRLHAKFILLKDNQTALVDLGSSNGTCVNNMPINRQFLMDGDEIQMGETFLIYSEGEPVSSDIPVLSEQIAKEKRAKIGAIPLGHPTQIIPSGDVQNQMDSLKEAYLHLRSIYKILSDMNRALDFEDLHRKVGAAMLMSLGADRIAFFSFDSALNDFTMQAAYVLPSLDSKEIARQYPISQEVLDSIRDDKESYLFTIDDKPAALAAPIMLDKELFGMIYTDSPASGRPFTKTDLDFVSTAALQMAPIVERLRQQRRLKEKTTQLERVINDNLVIVCRNPKMLEIMDVLNRMAEADSNVLIRGESGTGKELIARAIHAYSRRRDSPLICLNCASLPETLIESELFGYERGAFTGAVSRKPGKFELADGGTLFLDEIGDISPAAQAKILRALQEGEIQRIGGTTTLKVDVRIIAATNKDLSREIQNGTFREDLYYRLKVVEIDIPPLRERPEDIPILAEYFLKSLRAKTASRASRFSKEVLGLFLKYPWHGNVRELHNVVERALVFARGEEILPEHLPAELRIGTVKISDDAKAEESPLTLSEMERRHIVKTLDYANGNKLKAAELLGISRSTLYDKMRQYNLNI